MKKIAVIAALFAAMFFAPVVLATGSACKHELITIPFASTPDKYDGLNITDQYQAFGLSFAGRDAQDNLVLEGSFFRPYKILFNSEVCEVTLVIKGWSFGTQSYVLVAQNRRGVVIGRDKIIDPAPVNQYSPMPRALHVQDLWGNSIASVTLFTNAGTQLLEVRYER